MLVKCVFGHAFVELIMDRINSVRIDFIRTSFEIKWYIYIYVWQIDMRSNFDKN